MEPITTTEMATPPLINHKEEGMNKECECDKNSPDANTVPTCAEVKINPMRRKY
jgi:hypothetical protein